MQRSTFSKRLATCLAVSLVLALAGCSSGSSNNAAQPAATTDGTATTNTAEAASTPAVSGTVTLGYVEWDSCVAATNVVALALEDAGYTVKKMSVTGAMMYAGLANGDLDAIVCAWLPVTHKDYYAKTRDKLDNLGPNMKEAKLGLAVPAYVKINAIPELADPAVAKKFQDRIIGIDPGAGIMRLTHKVIEHYKLPEKLIEGSDATMTGVLKNSIRQNKPVVVTSWTPHWMWAAWDLKYLDDPDNVYGKPDDIITLARQGLKADMPKAWAILDAFKMDGDARSAVMVAGRDDSADATVDARAWMDAHPETVSAWMSAPLP